MSSRAQCPICIETYTARNALVCPRSECAFECCLGCAKQYLLGSHQEPHCMNCRYEYEIEFFLRAFTKSWRLSTYKTHRETLALEKEKAHLPAMMALVEQRRSIINLRTQRKLLEQQVEAINEQLRTLGAQRASREKVNNFRYKCPTDQCKGFLDAKMYCAMCDTGVCSDCFAPLADASDETHEAHVCNEEAKQNVTYIKRSAKPCPACGTMIQKISGCAQIFCTSDDVARHSRGTLVKSSAASFTTLMPTRGSKIIQLDKKRTQGAWLATRQTWTRVPCRRSTTSNA